MLVVRIFAAFCAFVIFAPLLAIFIPIWIKNAKHRLRARRERRIYDKIRLAKAAAEIEIRKKQADFELEKQREKMKPKFCPYCGAKRNNETNECEDCGADL
jgi:hypothetical protein